MLKIPPNILVTSLDPHCWHEVSPNWLHILAAFDRETHLSYQNAPRYCLRSKPTKHLYVLASIRSPWRHQTLTQVPLGDTRLRHLVSHKGSHSTLRLHRCWLGDMSWNTSIHRCLYFPARRCTYYMASKTAIHCISFFYGIRIESIHWWYTRSSLVQSTSTQTPTTIVTNPHTSCTCSTG